MDEESGNNSLSSWNGESLLETGEFDPGNSMDRQSFSGSDSNDDMDDSDDGIDFLPRKPIDQKAVHNHATFLMDREAKRNLSGTSSQELLFDTPHSPEYISELFGESDYDSDDDASTVQETSPESQAALFDDSTVEEEPPSDGREVLFDDFGTVMEEIVDHEGPLQPDHPHYQGCAYIVTLRYSNSIEVSRTLDSMISSGSDLCAEYALHKNLLYAPGWRRFRYTLLKKKRRAAEKTTGIIYNYLPGLGETMDCLVPYNPPRRPIKRPIKCRRSARLQSKIKLKKQWAKYPTKPPNKKGKLQDKLAHQSEGECQESNSTRSPVMTKVLRRDLLAPHTI